MTLFGYQNLGFGVKTQQSPNYIGNGSDGPLVTSTNQSISSTEDGDMVVSNYSNIYLSSSAIVTLQNRCKGWIIYCLGDCTILDTAQITMTARGASAAAPSDDIIIRRIGGALNGTQSNSDNDLLSEAGSAAQAAENNQRSCSGDGTLYVIKKAGATASGSQAIATLGGSYPEAVSGDAGVAGTNNYSNIETGAGGGGGGAVTKSPGTNEAYAGIGATGTAWSGGTGGGGACGYGTIHAGSGAASGGAGGAGNSWSTTNAIDSGGAGNPGGSCDYGNNGEDGTGGLLILIVGGTLRIVSTAAISSLGSDGGDADATGKNVAAGGGGSGGGNVLVLCRNKGTGIYEPILDTNILVSGGLLGGGSGGAENNASGGAGGKGSAVLDVIL